MRFAFKTSPQSTTWDAMLGFWRAADDIEVFESGWTSDHFYPRPGVTPPAAGGVGGLPGPLGGRGVQAARRAQ